MISCYIHRYGWDYNIFSNIYWESISMLLKRFYQPLFVKLSQGLLPTNAIRQWYKHNIFFNAQHAIRLKKLINISFTVHVMLTGVNNSSLKSSNFSPKSQFLINLHMNLYYSLNTFVTKQHKKHHYNKIIYSSFKLQMNG